MAQDTGGSVVLDQRNTTQFLPSGRFQEVVEVTFQTPSGVISHVYVPRHIFSADTAAAAVREATTHHEAVSQLGK